MSFDRALSHPGGALRILTGDAGIASRLEERLGEHLTTSDGATATLELAAGEARSVWNESLAGRVERGLLVPALAGVRGSFDLVGRTGRFEIDTEWAWFELHLENVLRMVLVELAAAHGHHICHAAAVAAPNGSAWLFLGPSGAGKTTITELAADAGLEPINDDLVYLSRGPLLEGCAFHGATRIRRFAAGRRTVAAIFRLRQSEANQVTPIEGAAATREIAGALVTWRQRTRAEQLMVVDFAEAIRREAPVFELAFRRDPGVWRAVRDVLHGLHVGVGSGIEGASGALGVLARSS